jgi:Suppressor of fused protein (SUFU)
VSEHVTRYFSARSVEVAPFDDGPIAERVPGFAEICVPPDASTPLCVYVSCGVWDAVHIDEHGLEFCLIAPERDHRHALVVAMNAYDHANPDESFRLDFEMCHWEHGHARILWLLPITESERDFRTAHGLEALEQRFDDARLQYWDARRSAVV